MHNDYREVSLQNIGNGVALELFERELKNVLKNIADINTDAKATRKITLEVSITPNETGEVGACSVKCTSKLAGLSPVKATMHFAHNGKELQAFEHNKTQPSLFDNKGNVTSIEGKARAANQGDED